MTDDAPRLSLRTSPRPDDTSPEAFRAWLRDHAVDEVECVVPDFAGIARGKVMPAAKYAEMKPIHLPVSIFFQTITGGWIQFEDTSMWREVDLELVPDLSTVRAVPWANDPSVQVIHDLTDREGAPIEMAPRAVLRRVLSLYEDKGWRPVVAPELEFYLTKPNTDPDYPIEPPVGRSGRTSTGNQAYSISAVDEYASVVEHIYDFAEAQRLEIDTVIQEAGAAQLEINLMHGAPLDLADEVFLFKRTIREAAMRLGCYATFMAKPMEQQPGSAMHLHQSIIDTATGQNVFSSADGAASDLFHRFIGGQQRYLPAAGCILAPYVNSYRRLMPDNAAPVNLQWGEDNRTAGLRIPISPPEARRVETRLAGADTNPYLAIAACLACGYLGMTEGVEPTPPIEDNAYGHAHDLPRSLMDAVELFDSCEPLKGVLGEKFTALFAAVKRHEYDEYMRVVSPWEREHLLLSV